jgi:hypothetical protein
MFHLESTTVLLGFVLIFQQVKAGINAVLNNQFQGEVAGMVARVRPQILATVTADVRAKTDVAKIRNDMAIELKRDLTREVLDGGWRKIIIARGNELGFQKFTPNVIDKMVAEVMGATKKEFNKVMGATVDSLIMTEMKMKTEEDLKKNKADDVEEARNQDVDTTIDPNVPHPSVKVQVPEVKVKVESLGLDEVPEVKVKVENLGLDEISGVGEAMEGDKDVPDLGSDADSKATGHPNKRRRVV